MLNHAASFDDVATEITVEPEFAPGGGVHEGDVAPLTAESADSGAETAGASERASAAGVPRRGPLFLHATDGTDTPLKVPKLFFIA